MKGVLLAGGFGARLLPLTKVTNKHLLPVYKKPMIFYPLEALIKAGISEILIVTGGEHVGDFFRLLGSGKDWDAHFSYEIQEGSGGTADALLLAESFVKDDEFMVILGDNVVMEDLGASVKDFQANKDRFKAKIMVAKVEDPEKYGVVTIKDGRIQKIIEKPKNPESNYVNTGLWMFLPEVFERLKTIKKSERGEYEVTDVLSSYAKDGVLSYSILNDVWTDAGSFESLYRATVMMHELEKK